LVTFIRGLTPDLQQMIAAGFGLPDELFRSWLRALYTVRNICAHHSRVWNRELGVKPLLPGKNKHPDWHIQPAIPNARVGIVLTICYFWLGKITSTTKWRSRLLSLFDDFPEIPLNSMGLPDSWRLHPLWTESSGNIASQHTSATP
ncbi:MAG: Abi family protein, partial [Opitutaceae bacterium]